MASLIDTWKADNCVYALSISPDGARLGAAVGFSVMIWDLHTGQVALGPLQSHAIIVHSVAFSPDGRTLASASYDATIRIWDTETGSTALGPLTGHTDYVYSVTFSPNGRLLISGSYDGTIRLWDVLTGQTVREPIQTGSYVYSVVISPDGARIYAALGNKTINAYDTDTGALLLTFASHESYIYSVAISPDGRRIASGSDGSTVRIWDAATGQAIGDPLTGHTGYVSSVAFSPDGNYIASGSMDQTIRIWNLETGALQIDPLHDHTDIVNAVVFALNSTHLVSGSSDKTMKSWNIHKLGIQTRSQHILVNQDVQKGTVEDEITGTTVCRTISPKIMARLGARGCASLTDQLNMATCGTHPISSGGFGDIYRCQLENGTEVAIKTLRLYLGSSEQNQKHLKYAAREVYAWSKCHHPNVQPLLGLAVFREQLGMIATWESSGSLPQYLEQNPAVDRCFLSTQITEGLLYLHASGIVHGDLKGANVLISQGGIPMLADFGNAVLQEYTLKFTKTSIKEAMSLRWAAPELFEGTTCSAPADIYALGMTILETITGDVPWMGKSERAVLVAVTVKQTHPERPKDHIPEDSEHGKTLWWLLQSTWEIEPVKRPSATEVKSIMKGITQGGLKHR